MKGRYEHAVEAIELLRKYLNVNASDWDTKDIILSAKANIEELESIERFIEEGADEHFALSDMKVTKPRKVSTVIKEFDGKINNMTKQIKKLAKEIERDKESIEKFEKLYKQMSRIDRDITIIKSSPRVLEAHKEKLKRRMERACDAIADKEEEDEQENQANAS